MSALRTWFSASEISSFALPGLPGTKRGVIEYLSREDRRRADKEGLWWRQRAGRGGGAEYNLKVLPIEAQDALLAKLRAVAGAGTAVDARAGMDRDLAWVRFNRLNDARREKARARLDAVVAVEDRRACGFTAEMAVAAACRDFKVGKSALYEWMERVQGIPRPDWIAHLVDSYTGGGAAAECSADAWEFFKSDYLRPSRPSGEACYRRLQRVAAEKGWIVPSCKTLKRRIETIRLPVRVSMRDGDRALKAMFPAQERDRTVFHALEAVCADGHLLDLFVKWEDGTIGRPQLLGFQDLYSGMILSWRLDQSENKEIVRLAFGDLVEEFGIPDHCYLDNGRAFASKWISGGAKSRFRFKVKQEDPLGVMEVLNVKVHFVTPYSGQSKPIERAWRDLAENVSKHPAFQGAYTGSNTQAKPADYGTRAVPIDTLLAVLADEIREHNARAGRKTRVCGGTLSFRQAFDESYKNSLIRKAAAMQRQFFFLMAEMLTVRTPDASLRLLGNRYWTHELVNLMGKRVVARFDPEQLHEDLLVYSMAGELLCRAPCVEAVGFNDVAAAQEHSRKRRAWMRAQKSAAEIERGMAITEVAALLDKTVKVPPPAPETKMIRLVSHGNAARAAELTPDADAIGADGFSDFEREFIRGTAKLRLVREGGTDA